MTGPARVGVRRDGQAVHAHGLAWPDGIAAEVWSLGARLASLTVPLRDGRRVEVLQTPADFAVVEGDTGYHGVVVGRVANRIAGARFRLDGREHRLTPNEGRNLLHSGAAGWSRRVWRFTEARERRCALELRSPVGEGGFPGAVLARVSFALTAPDALEIAWDAQVSAPTPIAMTHHLYFNLSGGAEPDIRNHDLQVAAPAYTPVNDEMIPTGELVRTAGTPFDFSRPRRLGEVLGVRDPQLTQAGGLDHTFVLEPRAPEAVRLRAPVSGLSLNMATDQPGVQVYTGQHLAAPFRPFGALALEPQAFPDAVNCPGFPPVIVRPGEPYRRFARYRFEAGAPA